jgi:hypothetical protein
MDTAGMSTSQFLGPQKPSFRLARSGAAVCGLEIEPIPIRMRLGTGMTLDPDNIGGQGIQKAKRPK